MFRDILVPLDGSAFAEAALPLGLSLTQASHARLHLVAAQEPWPGAIGAVEIALADTKFGEELLAESKAYLNRTAARLRGHEAGPVMAHQINGAAGPAICEEAARLGVDLVVMATHGRGSLRRFWLGSVADYLIRHLTIPVLLVPPRAQKGNHPATLGRIVVALDLSNHAESILEPTIALARATGAALTLVHVVELIFEVGRPGILGGIVTETALLEASRVEAQQRLDAIAARLRGLGLRVDTKVIVGSGAASGLLDALDEDAFDLIAMTTYGHSGMRRLLLGSVADKVIRGAAKPVLILRPPVVVAPEDGALVNEASSGLQENFRKSQ